MTKSQELSPFNAGDTFSATGLVGDKSKAAEKTQLKSGQLIEGDIVVAETLVAAMECKDAFLVLTSAVSRLEPRREEGMPLSFILKHGRFQNTSTCLGLERK